MALQWAKENSDVGHSGSGSFGLWWTGCILVRLQMVAVITDLLNFFFYKGLQNLDKPISNNADPPSWCIPFENCPERGFSGNRFIQAFSTCHYIRTGSWLLGIMRRIRRLSYLSSSLSPSGKLPVRIDGNVLEVTWPLRTVGCVARVAWRLWWEAWRRLSVVVTDLQITCLEVA